MSLYRLAALFVGFLSALACTGLDVRADTLAAGGPNGTIVVFSDGSENHLAELNALSRRLAPKYRPLIIDGRAKKEALRKKNNGETTLAYFGRTRHDKRAMSSLPRSLRDVARGIEKDERTPPDKIWNGVTTAIRITCYAASAYGKKQRISAFVGFDPSLNRSCRNTAYAELLGLGADYCARHRCPR